MENAIAEAVGYLFRYDFCEKVGRGAGQVRIKFYWRECRGCGAVREIAASEWGEKWLLGAEKSDGNVDFSRTAEPIAVILFAKGRSCVCLEGY